MSGAKSIGKELLSTVGVQAINTGVGFLNDIATWEYVLDSAKLRLKQGGNELLHTAKDQLMADGMHLAREAKRKLESFKAQRGSGSKRRKKNNNININSSKSLISKSEAGERGCKKHCKLPYSTVFDKL